MRATYKPIIHADFLPAEIDANYHPEVELIGHLAHTLRMLNERLDDHGAPEFDLSYQREIRAEMTAEFGWHKDDDAEGAIRPQKAVWDAIKRWVLPTSCYPTWELTRCG